MPQATEQLYFTRLTHREIQTQDAYFLHELFHDD